MDKPRIDLSGYKGAGIIILRESGVLYTNRTGGVLCGDHPSVEGVFFPLETSLVDYQALLNRWRDFGWPYSQLNEEARQKRRIGIDDKMADFIDLLLLKFNIDARVDRQLLRECEEAWVYVTIGAHPNSEFPKLDGFAPGKGILTWLNSD